MGAESKIEWTDATWEPVTGCTLVSEGCRNCYAALAQADDDLRLLAHLDVAPQVRAHFERLGWAS